MRHGIQVFGNRLKFRRGIQRRFIEAVKLRSDLTWGELAKTLNVSEYTIRVAWRTEETTLPEEVFDKLLIHVCNTKEKKMYRNSFSVLRQHWGRSLGGRSSINTIRKRNNLKIVENVTSDIRFSELIGVILGDGNISKKVIEVTLENPYENSYADYISSIVEGIFGIPLKKRIDGSRIRLLLYSVDAVGFVNSIGLKTGDKIKNQTSIPRFILHNEDLLKACMRGLIDTDGGMFRKDKLGNRIIIEFKNNNPKLLADALTGFSKLGYSVSKSGPHAIRIQNQAEVKKYMKDIGSHNDKIILKMKHYKKFGKFPTTTHIKNVMHQ